MTTTITLNLPDEVAQKLQAEAQQQNTTLENLATECLIKISSANPTTKPSIGEVNSLTNFFEAIHHAVQTKQITVQVPVNDIFVTMAKSLKDTGILLDFLIVDQQLILHVNPTPPPPVTLSPKDIDTSTLAPEAARIVEALKDEDETIRGQAILELAQWYKQQAG